MAKEKRDSLIGALVTSGIKAQVQAIADREERSLSFVAGALLERGLQIFNKDGLLRSRADDGKLGVIRARTELDATPRKKTKR